MAPVTIAKAHPCPTLILPEAIGRLPVRFIMASVSLSTTWLMALALPVTNIPPAKSMSILNHLSSYASKPLLSIKLITLLNTTMILNESLTNCK